MGSSTTPPGLVTGGRKVERSRIGLVAAGIGFFALGFLLGGLADEPRPDPAAAQRVKKVEEKAADIRSRMDAGTSR